MTPTRPYLIRALNDWINDNQMTPHILIDISVDGVDVPDHLINDSTLTLNISQTAVMGLEIQNDLITFSARFSGQSSYLRVPVRAVLAVYARESGKGMMFPASDDDDSPDDPDSNPSTRDQSPPHLKIIK